MIHVPFLDLARIHAGMQRDLDEAFARVARSGRYLQGPETAGFEEEFAAMCDARHCVGVANGLDALRLCLRAWISNGRLEPGDEVVVPANSFVASALAVTESGLDVRLADVDPDTCNVTAATIADALTARTRVVMPVHLYGRLADPDAIRELCRARGLLLLEDAAQAHGARAASGCAGSLGDAAGFSFYPAKNLGALGDAGALVSNDESLAARVRVLGNYGAAQKYIHEYRGTNSRIDELQAALLRVKLRHLAAQNERRRAIAARYRAGIGHPLVRLPAAATPASAHVWHLFVVVTPDRAGLAAHLAANGIETLVHYPRAIHAQPAFRAHANKAPTPVADRLQHEVLSLPMSPALTDFEADRVIDAVNRWDRTPAIR